MKLQQHLGNKLLSVYFKMFTVKTVGSDRMLPEKLADVVLEVPTLAFTDFTATKGSELTAFCQRRLSTHSES